MAEAVPCRGERADEVVAANAEGRRPRPEDVDAVGDGRVEPSVMVPVSPAWKVMTSVKPTVALASRMACRSEPAPLSR